MPYTSGLPNLICICGHCNRKEMRNYFDLHKEEGFAMALCMKNLVFYTVKTYSSPSGCHYTGCATLLLNWQRPDTSHVKG